MLPSVRRCCRPCSALLGMVWAEICGRRRSYGPSEQVAKEGRCQLRPGVWLEVGRRLPFGLAEQVSNARRCQTRRAAISCRPEQVHLQRFPWRIRYSSSSGTGERVTSGTFMPKARKFKSTKFGLPWPTRSHLPAPPQPRARRTRLRRCPSQVPSGVLNFLSPAGAGRGAVLNSSFEVLLRGTA